MDPVFHGGEDPGARGHHAEKRRRAAVDHNVAVDENFEIAVAAADHINVGLQLAAKVRRHTGGI
jgi:hypothetical protein